MLERSPESEACPLCGGRGWVLTADSGAGSARPCDCRRRDLGHRLMAAAGIPERYRNCTLDNFQPGRFPQLSEALAACRSYVESFRTPEGRFRQSGLLLIGPAGVGKTHLAVAVLKTLIQTYGIRGRFVELNALVQEVQATFGSGSPLSQQEVLAPLEEADLLVLDELGSRSPSPWMRDLLYLIINSRYSRQRPTLFTTNYRFDDGPDPSDGGLDSAGLDRGADPVGRISLSRRLPETLVSRLFEMAKPLMLDEVPDFRREVKKATLRA